MKYVISLLYSSRFLFIKKQNFFWERNAPAVFFGKVPPARNWTFLVTWVTYGWKSILMGWKWTLKDTNWSTDTVLGKCQTMSHFRFFNFSKDFFKYFIKLFHLTFFFVSDVWDNFKRGFKDCVQTEILEKLENCHLKNIMDFCVDTNRIIIIIFVGKNVSDFYGISSQHVSNTQVHKVLKNK